MPVGRGDPEELWPGGRRKEGKVIEIRSEKNIKIIK
jgi:hypothetical protein